MNFYRIIFSFLLLSAIDVFGQMTNQLYDHFFISAIECKVKGDYQQALDMFGTCTKIDNSKPASYYEIARILYDAGQDSLSAEFALNAVRLDSSRNVTYLQTAAEATHAAGRADDFVKCINKLISLQPDEVSNYLMLYNFYSEQKQYDDALKTLDRVPASNSGVAYELNLNRQRTYLDCSKPRKAKKILDKLYKENPNNPRTLYALSHYFYVAHDPEKCIEYCKRATLAPGGDCYLFTLADVYYNLSMDSLYTETFLRAVNSPAVSMEDKSTQYRDILFKNSFRFHPDDRNCYPFFYSVLKSLTDQYPQDNFIFRCFIDFMRFSKGPKSVVDFIRHFVNTFYVDETSWIMILSNFATVIPDDEYFSLAERAYNENPDNSPRISLIYGIKLFETDKFAESIPVFKEAVEFCQLHENPQYRSPVSPKPALLHCLASSYIKLDSADQCFSAYRELLKDSPNDHLALNNLSYYMAERDVNLDEAESMSAAACKLSPNNAGYLDTYAYVLYKRGKYQEALFVMNRSLDADSDPDATILDHYADILLKLGRIDDARYQWQRALSKEPANQSIINKLNELH